MLLKLISTAILALTVLSLGQGAVTILPSPCVSMSSLLTCRSCTETRCIAGPALFKISSLLFGPAQACLLHNHPMPSRVICAGSPQLKEISYAGISMRRMKYNELNLSFVRSGLPQTLKFRSAQVPLPYACRGSRYPLHLEYRRDE
ncbi:hypothetical protein B0H13DRAFT_2658912 [Mycena leptocephala]|nr:hypothetical protein B0H13DRAFT_2658912 [Mycena leptocephala]